MTVYALLESVCDLPGVKAACGGRHPGGFLQSVSPMAYIEFHSGANMHLWENDDGTVDVAVERADGESVLFAGASLLTDQPLESALSLVRMVAREG